MLEIKNLTYQVEDEKDATKEIINGHIVICQPTQKLIVSNTNIHIGNSIKNLETFFVMANLIFQIQPSTGRRFYLLSNSCSFR
jgi:hypothetical protein